MSYSNEIVSAPTTTRLRNSQSVLATTTALVDASSSPLSQSNIRREMAKRTEIEPLLASPSHSHDTAYTTDRQLAESGGVGGGVGDPTHSLHICIEHQKDLGQVGLAMSTGMEESLHLYREEEEDQSLLIDDKPEVIRSQVEHVFLFNFLAVLFVSINMILNLTVLAVIHERVPMNEPHLPDIAFDVLPDSRPMLDVAEYFIVAQMSGLFILFFFHKHRSIILRRVCIIMGVIYFFRAICMASTQLPLASKNYQCSAQLKNSSETANVSSLEFLQIIASRVFYMSLGMGLSINGHHAYCGDYIFSGHTVILTLTYLTFQEYLLPRRRNLLWKLFHLAQFVMTVISVICIIIARGHYLIDIVLAYFVTTHIFWIYHTLCNSTSSNMKALTNYFKRLWWWPVFVYFENVKHSVTPTYSVKMDESTQVQRIFEWPLPWPKRLAEIHHRKHRTQFMA